MDYSAAFEAAREAREHAYAPYSNFLVGAAVKLKNQDQIVAGFNIENGSYGATMCAERTAIFSAITQYRCKEFDYLLLVTEGAQPPCGLCLQVLSEFCDDDFPIILADPDGIKEHLKFKDFFPRRFKL